MATDQNQNPSWLHPFPVAVPLMPTSCQRYKKKRKEKKTTTPDKYPSHFSMQAWNKSCPITVGVNVLIHWSNIVAIQLGVPSSGPEIMIFCSPGDYTEQPARDKKPWARCFNRLNTDTANIRNVYGGARLTAHVSKHSRNVGFFLNKIMRQLWKRISLLIHRLLY